MDNIMLEREISKGTIKHSLKILPEYFEDVTLNGKRFELRKNDRDFKIGDLFVLREWRNEEYTGRFFIQSIKYILKDCEKFGLEKDFCIFCW